MDSVGKLRYVLTGIGDNTAFGSCAVPSAWKRLSEPINLLSATERVAPLGHVGLHSVAPGPPLRTAVCGASATLSWRGLRRGGPAHGIRERPPRGGVPGALPHGLLCLRATLVRHLTLLSSLLCLNHTQRKKTRAEDGPYR